MRGMTIRMEPGESPDRGFQGDSGVAEIRIQLCARIAALDVSAPYVRPVELIDGVEAIRRIAHRHGLAPAVTVTHFIDRALMREQNRAPVHGWFAILSDAITSERQDWQTANDFAEACSVRLSS
ncbi:hypothetical protein [Sphingomonas zeae]|jgi:hypothetical protein|nr:hypothetical protein [Sphingomonas zeae]